MGKMPLLNSSIKRIKDPVVRERLMMVRDSYTKPLREVAKAFGCTHGKVDFWKKRYESSGLRGLYTKSRPGRPPKITAEQSVKIRRTVKKHNLQWGWRTKQVNWLIYEEAGVKYTLRQTIRILQSWGLSKIKPRPLYAHSKKGDRVVFLKKTRATWHVSQKGGA